MNVFEILKRARVDLVNGMQHPIIGILDELFSNDGVSEYQKQQIQSIHIACAIDANRKLLDFIIQNGDESYRKFRIAALKVYPHFADYLPELDIDDMKGDAANAEGDHGCVVKIRSFGYDDRPLSNQYGFIKINDNTLFRTCESDRFFTDGEFLKYRGINTMVLDPVTWSASDWQWFDTYDNDVTLCVDGNNPKTVEDMKKFMRSLAKGTILIGMTADEPIKSLSPALGLLQEMNVNVSDVKFRGKFAFILQKGFPEKTLVAKNNNRNEPLELHATIKDSGEDGLEIKRIDYLA